MLTKDNFSEEHIRALQRQSRRDPALLERTVFALGLLEAITRVGMPFIFKGGSCLLLLLKNPMRLSTDIDIVVEPGTDVDAYIRKASTIFPFEKSEEQVRVGKNKIVKRHFKPGGVPGAGLFWLRGFTGGHIKAPAFGSFQRDHSPQ